MITDSLDARFDAMWLSKRKRNVIGVRGGSVSAVGPTDRLQRWSREVVEDNINPALRRDVYESLRKSFDAGLMVDARTWLPGDFDPRTLRRRRGWALRRYRGEHRDKALTVGEIRDSIAARAHFARMAHLRSLRRPADPGPIYIGTMFERLHFYVPPGEIPEGATATIEFMPDEALQMVPCLIGPAAPDTRADDADTGPIWMSPQRGHEERMARIDSTYDAVKQHFDAGITRED